MFKPINVIEVLLVMQGQSVLGLVKVVIARLPAEELEQHLRSLVEGLMLWSDDSKNHFKAKVCGRVLI